MIYFCQNFKHITPSEGVLGRLAASTRRTTYVHDGGFDDWKGNNRV